MTTKEGIIDSNGQILVGEASGVVVSKSAPLAAASHRAGPAPAAPPSQPARAAAQLRVALLTACLDPHYSFSLAMALAAHGVAVDFVGGDAVDGAEMHTTPNVHFVNLWPALQRRSPVRKIAHLLGYYARLVRWVASSRSGILHILWNGKLELVDRTLLMLYYKACGKKVTLTAHNVNRARRDEKDSSLNRLTLQMQYRLCDHIFVHTRKMQEELCQEFHVAPQRVTVIPYPMNQAVPETELSSAEARRRLGLPAGERVILFFGRIRPYKGIEHLIAAFRLLPEETTAPFRLLVAGEPTRDAQEYLRALKEAIAATGRADQVTLRVGFIPDAEVESYFKAADVLVLPYKEIFQSGVLILAYRFGLPVVATDVGSFREHVVAGRTGFLCDADDPADLARALREYFASELYRNLEERRDDLKQYASEAYSWDAVADRTCSGYAAITAQKGARRKASPGA